MPLIHFLLVYDHARERLVRRHEFADAAEAAAAYTELERENRGKADIEIVLVGADSIETIRQTHGNYFNGDAEALGATTLTGTTSSVHAAASVRATT
jgi:hypothetical protein